ncbi:uncharacterized protein PV06_09941 [Exophiala oligosperma]|uniref:Vacuolar ATPase assembly protein VMA22 n=1 Tax=Exophiala oligosperma TaxID=215243 RepID=A0A0D2D3Y3_9EURO|nr:uncharacterized protein PV06_09941 [Exophiala oligosperma]KIW37963.1 hypothetical protein PV06_09941 [Exophiala oligosperma]
MNTTTTTTHLPSPPTSRPTSPTPLSKDARVDTRVEEEGKEDGRALSERLDDLLASYLTLLDTYTNLRTQLSKEFSFGFYALAQANRNTNLGPGRRYGEEGYDERMKALKTVHIMQNAASKSHCSTATGQEAGENDETTTTPPKGSSPTQIGVPSSREEEEEGHSKLPAPKSMHNQDASEDDQGSLKQSVPPSTSPSYPVHATSHPAPCCYTYSVESDTTTITTTNKDRPSSTSSSSPASPSPLSSDETSVSDTQDKAKTKVKVKAISKDPLKWYGILVPPALRQCQSHFHGSMSSTIPELLGIMSALQRFEVNIWETRRALGMAEEYEHEWDESSAKT